MPPVPQQSPTISLTDSEQQLVNKLNPDLLTDCKSRSTSEHDGGVAAINCQNVKTGPTKRPLVVQFADIESAQTWVRNNTDGFVDQDNCAGGYKLGDWTHKGEVAGTLGCSYTTEGNFRIVWVINNVLIGVIADGSDGSTSTHGGGNRLVSAGADPGHGPGQARSPAARRAWHDPADHHGDQAVARRPHHPTPIAAVSSR
jgi:hypothetical protein